MRCTFSGSLGLPIDSLLRLSFMSDHRQVEPAWPHSSTQARSVLTFSILGIALFSSLPTFLQNLPIWAQPSIVGMVWGGLFLVGFALASAGRVSFAGLMTILASAILQTLAFRRITDLSIHECTIVTVGLVGSGWLVRRMDRRFSQLASESQSYSKWQVPLVDFFIATSLIACLASAINHMNEPPILLASVIGTLIVGCGCSWAAYHWAWNDQRPVGVPLSVVAIISLLGLGILIKISPLTATELAAWLLMGPLSVMAAQAFTVLLTFGLMRWQIPVVGVTSRSPSQH